MGHEAAAALGVYKPRRARLVTIRRSVMVPSFALLAS